MDQHISQTARIHAGSKVDPSFKSKRYRDKLRAEMKALESLLPVVQPAISRKLDSQTVYRITIAYLRIKAFFKALDGEKEMLINGYETENADETSGSTNPGNDDKSEPTVDHQQSLDGCVLVVSADGTIMYATENVHQFLGYQQIDLIHRCIYGIVHPVDQGLVRDALENNGEFSFQQHHYDHWPDKTTGGHSAAPRTEQEPSVPLSCYCRLKCFNKHGATYAKFHVTGKIQHVPNLPRSTKTCSRVALLFCRPFLYSEYETMQENSRCVFGSKHDLDLKFQDAEDSIHDVLGYKATELFKTSLYQLVHPDDLCLLVHVHKTIIEVNEVQSIYLRLQDKGGNWVWLHCKGKVICKHSKKFSIVFTHRPLRDEDITFIDHETTLRRYFSANNLMTLSKPPSKSHHITSSPCLIKDSQQSLNNQYQSKHVRTQDITEDCFYNERFHHVLNQTSLYLSTCPSTWHANSERHSPVLPSCHMVPKIPYRDKYRHLMRDGHGDHRSLTKNVYDQQNDITPHTMKSGITGKSMNHSSALTYLDQNMEVIPCPRFWSGLMSGSGQSPYRSPFHPYPPSPPPSPQFCHPHHLQNKQTWEPAAKDKHNTDHHGNKRKCQDHIESHTSIRVSMVYNSNINCHVNRPLYALQMAQEFPTMYEPFNGCHGTCFPKTHPDMEQSHMTQYIKSEPLASQSCAFTQPQVAATSNNVRQYDIEASVHMRIVEAERTDEIRPYTAINYCHT